MTSSRREFVCAFIGMLSICACTLTVEASVIYVDESASSATHDGSSWCSGYLSLQDALGAASFGDEVL